MSQFILFCHSIIANFVQILHFQILVAKQLPQQSRQAYRVSAATKLEKMVSVKSQHTTRNIIYFFSDLSENHPSIKMFHLNL